jgi:DNA-binding MarR family transcriptional regulator
MESCMPEASILCAATNLRMASRATGRAYDRALASLDLNTTQYALLANIGRQAPIASMALSDLLSLERTALYRALVVLQRRGLILAEAGRGREEFLSLTPAGQALWTEARDRWQVVQDRFTAALGKDWQTFLTMTTRARAIAEEIAP